MDILGEIKTGLKKKIIRIKEHNSRRIYLDIAKSDISAATKFLFNELDLRFCTISAVDTLQGIELIYHFSHDADGIIINLRVLLKDNKSPEIDSIGKFIKAAEWIEREIRELFGVNFKGHPNPKHLLLVDEWPKGSYPLRKDAKKAKP